ncbi:plasmid recombination protein [Sphingomonas yunnanensis]|uniref:plasmid recombination protein n=1 Tax=Sphingomonas yunnanensis TaxID=310400 RepID=UPI001CA73972|nr:plasmid recombination protein [Sphingomonas yunnanensis]MBY9062635.1 plasmid recombination protein [Sphingomonas yunnanensis]
MKAFAIIRHQKIKAGRHLVATGLHNARGIETPNANKGAPPVEIMVGTKKPWRDVTSVMDRLGIAKVRKNGNVAIEVILGASPEWWSSHGWRSGIIPSGATLDVIEAWKADQLAYLRSRFGEHLIASVVFHQDEASPHVHALIVPAQFRQDGREKGDDAGPAWRLSTEKMLPGPNAMKAIVTDYAGRMASFGLVRGEDRPAGTTRHKPLKEWQAEQADLSNKLGREFMRQIDVTEEAHKEAERIKREANDYVARIRLIAETEAKEARELIVMREEILRRKEDAASAVRQEIRAEHTRVMEIAQAAEVERRALQTARDRLETMISKVETMLEPIRRHAAKWLESSPLVRQAIGPRGREAVAVVGSEDVANLAAMKLHLQSDGKAR